MAGAGRVASSVVCALLIAGGATACGGKTAATTTQGQQPASATAPGAEDVQSPAAISRRAVTIKSRLTAGGYFVHPVKLPLATGPVDPQTRARAPKETFVVVQKSVEPTFVGLQDELATITRQAGARAARNLPMTQQTFRRLSVLHAGLESLSKQEQNVYVFSSGADAALYTKQFDDVNAHRLSLPGKADITRYEVVGPVLYFVVVDSTNGKENFDQSTLDKFVALAEGRN